VAVWRRLRQLGAIAPAGSLYLLPATEANEEAFDWLAQEVEAEGGEALVLRIEGFQGAAEGRLVELFKSARDEDYRKIAVEAEEAARLAGKEPDLEAQEHLREQVERLRRRLADVARIDFFQAAEGVAANALVVRLEEALARRAPAAGEIPAASRERYRGRRWVTRPRPHVDRLACAWLIRRFIDPRAAILWLASPADCPPDALGFDFDGAAFTHVGDRVSFETLMASFGLEDDAALMRLATIVHHLDVGGEPVPEAVGFEAVMTGARERHEDDDALLADMSSVLDSLYAHFQRLPANGKN